MFRALNHYTGEILEAKTFKQIYMAIDSERRKENHNHQEHSFITIHKVDYQNNNDIIYESML